MDNKTIVYNIFKEKIIDKISLYLLNRHSDRFMPLDLKSLLSSIYTYMYS